MSATWKKGLWAVVSLLALACGRPYDAATPDGFVELSEKEGRYDEAHHEYRASTADGVVIGVRAFDNEPKVDLTVAVRALENRVRLGEGYALLGKKEVTSRDGVKGMQLSFGHDETGGPHLYEVVVFVNDDWVYILESGGKKDLIEKARASIDWFVRNFATD